MYKIRKWLNKPKKEVKTQLMIPPLTPERKHQTCHDVSIAMEMLSSTSQRLFALLMDLRNLDPGLIRQTRTDGSDPEFILTTRLSMLRELLQGDIFQEEEDSDVQQKHYCPEHLKTKATTVTRSPPTFAPLSVWRSLTPEQVTGDGIQMCRASAVTSVSTSGLPFQPFLKTRDDCSLDSSPHPAGRSRLPCSLPCSPLLGGRRWRHPPSSPSPHQGLSRLWVEAALQRSKNIHQTEARPLQPCSPQERREGLEQGVRSSLRETEEEGTVEEWRDNESEEDKKLNTVNIVGIRLSDTIIFRPKTSSCLFGREEEEEEKEEKEEQGEEEEEKDLNLLCLHSEMSRYCLLTPCICFRCPSAPPYEAEVPSACDIQTVSSFSSEDEKHSQGLPQLSHSLDLQRTDVQQREGGSEQSLTRDRAPQQGESSCLYPSLSLWRITADDQTKLSRKQEVNSFESQLNNTIQSCFHGNNTHDHLQELCEMISGVSGELLTLGSADLSFILKKVFDSTTCSERTDHPVESCSFCSDKLGVQIMTHLCRNCNQVFCSRCLGHFVSLLQIHQFSQTAAI